MHVKTVSYAHPDIHYRIDVYRGIGDRTERRAKLTRRALRLAEPVPFWPDDYVHVVKVSELAHALLEPLPDGFLEPFINERAITYDC